jgi:hypothetical protein
MPNPNDTFTNLPNPDLDPEQISWLEALAENIEDAKDAGMVTR